MTFLEAMLEANRRMGIPEDETAEVLRHTRSIIVNAPLDAVLTPGSEEEVIQGLLNCAAVVHGLTPEQKDRLREHIIKRQGN